MSLSAPASRAPKRLAAAVLTLTLAALFSLPALAQDSSQRRSEGVPVPRDVQLQAVKQMQRDLLMQGAKSRIAAGREFARQQRQARRKGLPAPVKAGARGRQAFDEDPPSAAMLRREALRASLQSTQAIPANTRCNNPVGDAANAGQAEESVAALGNNILVAWNDGQGFNLNPPDVQGYGYSTDGGATFVDGGVPAKPAAFPSWVWTSDPVVTVNEKTGRFYYCGLANPDGSNNAIGVAYGHFSGSAFVWDGVSVVRTVSNSAFFLDKQWIAADSLTGNVYVSNTTFDASDHIDFYRSTDGGLTWSAPQQVSLAGENGRVQGSRPAVGPAGEVYMVWSSLGSSDPDQFYLRKSTNQGASFGTRALVSDHMAQFGTGAPGFNRERGLTFPSIAVDRTNGVNRGRVYVAWNETWDIGAVPFAVNGGKVEDENNGFAAVATPFTPGQTLRGILASANPSDFDWWSFTASAGDHVAFWCDSQATNMTYTCRLFAPTPDSLQRLMFGGDIGTTGRANPSDTYYAFTAPVAGTYFLRMVPARTTSTGGAYRILTSYGDPAGYRARDQRDAFVAWSDNGATWSPPARVNDNGVGFDDWLPEVAVGADGCPYVTFFDFRDDAFGSRTHQYVSRSTDGGATWAVNQRFTSAQGNFTTSTSNIAPNQGDYSHVFGDDRYLRATWADGRGTSVDVYSASWDTWFDLAGCLADQVVIPRQPLAFAWSVTNLNPLFTNNYTYAVSSSRAWPGPSTGALGLAPLAGGVVSLDLTVPDTAAAGANRITFTVTNSRGALVRSCSTVLSVNPGQAGVDGAGALAFALRPVQPNPARGSARLDYALPREGRVALRIYGLQGELVRTLVDGVRPAGPGSVTWDGRDDSGRAAGAGAYFARLEGLGRTASQRLVWMR